MTLRARVRGVNHSVFTGTGNRRRIASHSSAKHSNHASSGAGMDAGCSIHRRADRGCAPVARARSPVVQFRTVKAVRGVMVLRRPSRETQALGVTCYPRCSASPRATS